MKSSQELYPALDQAMGGYFHQDWFDEFRERGEEPSEDVVLHRMIARNSEDRRLQTLQDLQHLLATTTDEESLRRIIVDDMGAQVDPRLDDSTMRAWLEHIADLHRESLRGASHPNGRA